MLRFRARLYRIGILRCVDVPGRISHALGGERNIPVRGKAAAIPFRSTLVARGKRAHRLFVHSRSWRTHGLDAGDRIEIELERDGEPRTVAVPPDFLRALDDRPAARRGYASAPDGLRREIADWVAAAKRAETRERRIEKALDVLEARAARRRRK